MSWLGSVLVLTGRGLLAYDALFWGFAIGALGDVCWLWFGVRGRIWSLVFLDGVLLATDVVGVVRH